MDKVVGKLTVYFEDPFWVGIFERIDGVSYQLQRLYLERSQRIMKFKSS